MGSNPSSPTMEVWLNGSQYRLVTPCGTGSNPVISASFRIDLVAQLVEHDTFNVGVAGSNPAGVTTCWVNLLVGRGGVPFKHPTPVRIRNPVQVVH